MVKRVKITFLSKRDIGSGKYSWLDYDENGTHEEYNGTILEEEMGQTIIALKHTEGIGEQKTHVYERLKVPEYFSGSFHSADKSIYPWMIAKEEDESYTLEDINKILEG